jgi:hypothetical protein
MRLKLGGGKRAPFTYFYNFDTPNFYFIFSVCASVRLRCKVCGHKEGIINAENTNIHVAKFYSTY